MAWKEPKYMPTPEQIETDCQFIQEAWTKLQRKHALGIAKKDLEQEVPPTKFLRMMSNRYSHRTS